MFTGIVTDIGTIRDVDRAAAGDTRVVVTCGYDMASVAIGASIACAGACLTVVAKGPDWFAVNVSDETMACTVAERWQPGRRLNLERALRVGDELGGHIVTGHVDGIGTVVEIEAIAGSHMVEVAVPHDLAPFIASKGSVTVDGVSLTVNEVSDVGETSFALNIIPHSWSVTTLGTLEVGDAVNIEIDTLARYLKRMTELQPG
jgi:riboflavin synthase